MIIILPCPLINEFVGNFKIMAHVLEHRDIESHGLELIVQKQGALLLKEVVDYVYEHARQLKTLPFGASGTCISRVPRPPGTLP